MRKFCDSSTDSLTRTETQPCHLHSCAIPSFERGVGPVPEGGVTLGTEYGS